MGWFLLWAASEGNDRAANYCNDCDAFWITGIAIIAILWTLACLYFRWDDKRKDLKDVEKRSAD